MRMLINKNTATAEEGIFNRPQLFRFKAAPTLAFFGSLSTHRKKHAHMHSNMQLTIVVYFCEPFPTYTAKV